MLFWNILSSCREKKFDVGMGEQGMQVLRGRFQRFFFIFLTDLKGLYLSQRNVVKPEFIISKFISLNVYFRDQFRK